ncbi:MAG: B12-binding domain-containing radical SAM protein [bacterium]|nr:B12-binding domain-containing radical SAM protein [bacterium]
MRVLLIHPPDTNSIRYFGSPFYSLAGKKQHPLSLLYIATYLRLKSGIDVRVLDFPEGVSDSDYLKATREVVQSFRPDIVGITLYTLSLYDSYQIAKLVKSENRDVFVVAGGIHSSLYPYEILSQDFIDALIVGESEIAFHNLVENFRTDKMFQIKGLWIKKDGQIYSNGNSDIILDLDSIPFPDRSLVLNSFYSNLYAGANEVITIASRGCPYSCSYCQLARRNYRIRSPKNIVDEIEYLVDMGYNFISFADDTMNVNINHTKDLCREIIKRNLKINWSFRGVAKTLDEESVELMKESGCKIMFLGAESGSDNVLRSLKRAVKTDDVRRAVFLARRYGIKVALYFVIGFPNETERDIQDTIDFCISVKPNYAQANIFVPTPGSELYSLLVRSGFKDWCKDFTLSPKKDFEFPFFEKNFSKKKLQKLQRKFYRKFYLRPTFLLSEIFSRIFLIGRNLFAVRAKRNGAVIGRNSIVSMNFSVVSGFIKFAFQFVLWIILGKNPSK